MNSLFNSHIFWIIIEFLVIGILIVPVLYISREKITWKRQQEEQRISAEMKSIDESLSNKRRKER